MAGHKSKSTSTKVPVSERALMQRINRKLAKEGTHGELLKKVRAERGEGISQMRLNVGDYYIVDIARNYIAGKFINLEKKGRELGVLADWEELAE